MLPAVVGLLAGAAQVVQGQADSWVVPAYGVFMAVWSTFFLEFWKREEARKGVEWGLSGFEETQRPRPGNS